MRDTRHNFISSTMYDVRVGGPTDMVLLFSQVDSCGQCWYALSVKYVGIICECVCVCVVVKVCACLPKSMLHKLVVYVSCIFEFEVLSKNLIKMF